MFTLRFVEWCNPLASFSALPYDNSMNYDYFQELLNVRPFEPFAIRLSSGVVHQVRYPGCAALTRSRIAIADPDADKIVVCSLLHITSVELLQAPTGRGETA